MQAAEAVGTVTSARIVRWLWISRSNGGVIEQIELSALRCLKVGQVAVELLARDRHAPDGALGIALLDPPPELLDGHIEIVELHARSQRTGAEPFLVSLHACPEPALQDDTLAEPEEVLGELPQQPFEPVAHRLVMQIDAQVCHPLVGAQTYG